jgi:hypothetical protein
VCDNNDGGGNGDNAADRIDTPGTSSANESAVIDDNVSSQLSGGVSGRRHGRCYHWQGQGAGDTPERACRGVQEVVLWHTHGDGMHLPAGLYIAEWTHSGVQGPGSYAPARGRAANVLRGLPAGEAALALGFQNKKRQTRLGRRAAGRAPVRHVFFFWGTYIFALAGNASMDGKKGLQKLCSLFELPYSGCWAIPLLQMQKGQLLLQGMPV